MGSCHRGVPCPENFVPEPTPAADQMIQEILAEIIPEVRKATDIGSTGHGSYAGAWDRIPTPDHLVGHFRNSLDTFGE